MTAFIDTFYSISVNANGQLLNGIPVGSYSNIAGVSSFAISGPVVIMPAAASVAAAGSIVSSAAIIAVVGVSGIFLSPRVSVVATTQVVYPIASSISNRFRVKLSFVDVFRSGILEDTSTIKPFFSLDGVPLTEHNRMYNSSLEIKKVVNKRSNGSSGVYFKTGGTKKTFKLSWSYVPGSSFSTVDLNAGRDYISAKAADPKAHVLVMRNIDSSGLTPYTSSTYNVFFTDYSESLKRRDIGSNEYYWDCSCVLQEV